MHCEQMLFAYLEHGRWVDIAVLDTKEYSETQRIELLEKEQATVLACGGIDRNLKVELEGQGIEVIHNVAGETERVLEQLAKGDLRPGYGISCRAEHPAVAARAEPPTGIRPPDSSPTAKEPPAFAPEAQPRIDCIACTNRACLHGDACPGYWRPATALRVKPEQQMMMEVGFDIGSEPNRVLCRLAELAYFCVEMRYRHVGLAFCVDLFPETEVIARVLRRFTRVTPVCCRIGLAPEAVDDTSGGAICNAIGMAQFLNVAQTDLNVVVGLSMGCDVAFGRLSRAPVTTLVVKDKLLANNPAAACYSRYVFERILERPSGSHVGSGL
jgi:uncharacterized metal-binding protein/predicted Fe-Mo cluster-binding NifX family protein